MTSMINFIHDTGSFLQPLGVRNRNDVDTGSIR
jgi:hypothetical protein